MLSQLSFFSRQRRKELTSNSSKCVSTATTIPVDKLSSSLKNDSHVKKDSSINTDKSSSSDQSLTSQLNNDSNKTISSQLNLSSNATPLTSAVQLKLASNTLIDKSLATNSCESSRETKEPTDQQMKVDANKIDLTLSDVNKNDSTNCSFQSTFTPGEPTNRQQCKPGSSFLKLTFRCQLAHGSPTQMISGFSNMKELYEKIASTFNIPTEQILYCTLNTPKVDMDQLLGGQIGLEDFIFAHCKGQPKEVELTKNEELLGLTITDNGTGYSFIKKIKPGSLVDSIKFISVGDVIEKIEGKCFVGSRHFSVAKALKDLPIGHTFTLRLIEPSKGGFSSIGPRLVPNNHSPNLGSGRETLRLRANGSPVSSTSELSTSVIEKINVLLESFMGIHDNELATQIWETGSTHGNPHDFVMAIGDSDLQIFGFNEDLLFDLWGVINDSKTGQTNSKVNPS